MVRSDGGNEPALEPGRSGRARYARTTPGDQVYVVACSRTAPPPASRKAYGQRPEGRERRRPGARGDRYNAYSALQAVLLGDDAYVVVPTSLLETLLEFLLQPREVHPWAERLS